MKSESPFSKLPSLGELLSHPTVARVVKRVNQTTVAQRATGFLEELQTNIRQRADWGNIPSVGQLAERLARRLLGPAESSIPCVNATGILLGDCQPTPPLAEVAVDELVRVSTEYLAANSTLSDRVATALVETTGAESAWVTHSFAVAEKTARAVGGNVIVARYAGLLNPGDFSLVHYETIAQRLESADMVVVDGAGLLGGPSCGIVVGKEEKIAECVRHAPIDENTANELTLAALCATMKIYQSGDRVTHQIPLWQLLTTPLENLEQRAQRIATLLTSCKNVASAQPTRCTSVWCESDAARLANDSWAVVIKPDGEEGNNLRDAFLEATPRINCRDQQNESQDGEVWLDLRGVFPRWDQHLVAACE
ncbi:PLP-dependent aminotransferase family protein [Bythopirellula goksoeyrii]|uniref:L-seryl-tRNA(Sec) selenium transferase n=1 Tax=Bythopirellula goksoeyrii TaxID=1400387 RepID=A0A5B9QC50_9BACT|nr:hypothetical protein [Bythopirellula goksoeyrii]QEG36627.1 L-seryl-tRNA(Sec) selenium transferase [Bythopirellula goksoeyrii]